MIAILSVVVGFKELVKTNDNGNARITDTSVNSMSRPQGIYKYSEILRNTKYM